MQGKKMESLRRLENLVKLKDRNTAKPANFNNQTVDFDTIQGPVSKGGKFSASPDSMKAKMKKIVVPVVGNRPRVLGKRDQYLKTERNVLKNQAKADISTSKSQRLNKTMSNVKPIAKISTAKRKLGAWEP